MLALIKPYLMYAKIAMIVVALAGAGMAGHWVTKNYYLAKQARTERAAQVEYKASVEMFKQSIKEKDAVVAAVTKDNLALEKKLRVSQTQRNKEITDATANRPTGSYSVGFGWVWNDSICRSNGVPGCTGDSGGLAADARDSDITSEALLRNHTEVTELLGACYRNLGKIKAAQDKLRKEK